MERFDKDGKIALFKKMLNEDGIDAALGTMQANGLYNGDFTTTHKTDMILNDESSTKLLAEIEKISKEVEIEYANDHLSNIVIDTVPFILDGHAIHNDQQTSLIPNNIQYN